MSIPQGETPISSILDPHQTFPTTVTSTSSVESSSAEMSVPSGETPSILPTTGTSTFQGNTTTTAVGATTSSAVETVTTSTGATNKTLTVGRPSATPTQSSQPAGAVSVNGRDAWLYAGLSAVCGVAWLMR
jgi:hypothetical protein